MAFSLRKKNFVNILFLLLLIGFIAVGYFLWIIITSQIETRAEENFTNEVLQQEDNISDYIRSYHDLLLSLDGWIEADDQISRLEWANYYKQQEIEERYPGINTITFVEKINKTEISEYENNLKTDLQEYYPNEDFGSFVLQNTDTDSEYLYIVKFIQPNVDGSRINSLGLNFGFDEVRLEALIEAEETEDTTTTPLIKFLTGPYGFVMVQHATNHEGRNIFILLSIRSEEFFSEIFTTEINSSDIGYNVYEYSSDSQPLELIYNSTDNIEKVKFYKSVYIPFGQRTWKVEFYSDNYYGLVSVSEFVPALIEIVYSFFAVVIIMPILFLRSMQKNAEIQVKKKTSDLNDSKEMLQSIIDNTPSIIYMRNKKGDIVLSNHKFNSFMTDNMKALRDIKQSDIFKHKEDEVIDEKVEVKYEVSLAHGKTTNTYYFTTFPIKDDKDEIVYICTVGTDVSEITNYQSKIESRNRELEKLNKIMINRELKMVELKKQSAELKATLDKLNSK